MTLNCLSIYNAHDQKMDFNTKFQNCEGIFIFVDVDLWRESLKIFKHNIFFRSL